MRNWVGKMLGYVYESMLLPIFAVVFFILAFCFEHPKTVLEGYVTILLSKSILLTDYIAIAGIGATFLNVSTILVFNLIVFKAMKLHINGPIFAGLMIILGFSFFGKNILNTLPIYLGIFIHSKIKGTHFRNYTITLLFSTGISPLVSYTMFSFAWYIGIPAGIIVGIIAGILIPTLASHTVLFHKGYNLYNTGFALGIISVLFYAIYLGLGIEVVTVNLVCNDYHSLLFILLVCISAFAISIGIICNHRVILDYIKILSKSGRLVSDFIKEGGKHVVLFNFGFLGLVSVAWVLLFNITLNGATFGTILAIMGFASYGLHIANALPIWGGAIIAILLRKDSFTEVSTVMAFFFATGLAPIAGKYGIIYGALAGFLHINITPLMLNFQGGFDLYNNGFSAGFVATLLVNIKEALTTKEKY